MAAFLETEAALSGEESDGESSGTHSSQLSVPRDFMVPDHESEPASPPRDNNSRPARRATIVVESQATTPANTALPDTSQHSAEDEDVFDALLDGVDAMHPDLESVSVLVNDGKDLLDDSVADEQAFLQCYAAPPDFASLQTIDDLDKAVGMPRFSHHADNATLLRWAGLGDVVPEDAARWLLPLKVRGLLCRVLEVPARVSHIANVARLPDATMTRKCLELAFYFEIHFLEAVALRTLIDQVASAPLHLVQDIFDPPRLWFVLKTCQNIFLPRPEPHSQLCLFNVIDPQETLLPLFADLGRTPSMRALVDAPDSSKAVATAMESVLTPIYKLTEETVRRPFIAWRDLTSKLMATAGKIIEDRPDKRQQLEEVQIGIEMQVASFHDLALARLRHYNFQVRPNDPSHINVPTYQTFLTEKSPKSNHLYNRLLRIIYEKGFRKDDRGRVVRAKYIGGYFAYYYEVAHDTVYDMLNRLHTSTLNPDLIEFINLGENIFKTFATRLTDTDEEVFFPTTHRIRTVMAFRDGLLDLKNLVFVPHSHSSATVFPRDGCASVYHDECIGHWWDKVKSGIYPPGHVPATPAQAEAVWRKMRAVRNYTGSMRALRDTSQRRTEAMVMRCRQRREAERASPARQDDDFDLSEAPDSEDEQAFAEIRHRCKVAEEEAAKRLQDAHNAEFASIQERNLFKKWRPFKYVPHAEIDTPAVETLFMYQLVEPDKMATRQNQEEYMAILAMLGRLLFDVGDMDRFDIMPWFEGPGGCGKSSVQTHIKSCFDPDDVAIMSNTIEETFGTSPLAKSKIVLGYEIGLGFRLPHLSWLSMVVGEMVSSASKNKDPLMQRWTSSMMFVGNGFPAWNDQQGQTSRRIFHVHMRRVVLKQNLNLAAELTAEVGAFILKAVCAYHNLLLRVGRFDQVWQHLPMRFREARKNLQIRLNVVLDFIFNSEQVRLAPGQSMPASDFRRMLSAHCTTAKKTAPASLDEILSVLAQYDGDIHVKNGPGGLAIVGICPVGLQAE